MIECHSIQRLLCTGMRNRLDKRGFDFNEMTISLHPFPIRCSVGSIGIQTRIRVANPDRGFTPLHVEGLSVKLLDGYMRLSTEPLLVSVKESKTTSDVVEDGVLGVGSFSAFRT